MMSQERFSVSQQLLLRARIALTKRPHLFPFLHKITGRTWKEFCETEHRLCLEGYESSANSFVYNALQCVWPNLEVAHHKHVVANLKRAVLFDIPTIVLFRNPADCIPSFVCRFCPEPVEAVTRYIHFYRWVTDHATEVFLVSFEEATQAVESTVHRIADFAALPLQGHSLARLEERAKSAIRRRTNQRGDVDNISLPKAERDQQKDEVRAKPSDMPSFKEARTIYADLQSLREQQEEKRRQTDVS
jgi:hypothetical protein